MAALEMQDLPGSGPVETWRSRITDYRRWPERWSLHISENVRIARWFPECQLLALTFCIGIQDACSFPDYHCFASNQTGNTVLLAISIFNVGAGELFDVKNIGISLACFLTGCFVIGQIGHLKSVGQRRRLWLIGSNALQTAMVSGAAAIQFRYGGATEGEPALATLALLSFASGAQVTLSRAFACTEISTAMATAAWVDLMLDSRLWQRDNRARNRRLVFLFALSTGAVVGGAMYTHVGSANALLCSAMVKGAVTVSLLFNPKEVPTDRNDSCNTG